MFIQVRIFRSHLWIMFNAESNYCCGITPIQRTGLCVTYTEYSVPRGGHSHQWYNYELSMRHENMFHWPLPTACLCWLWCASCLYCLLHKNTHVHTPPTSLCELNLQHTGPRTARITDSIAWRAQLLYTIRSSDGLRLGARSIWLLFVNKPFYGRDCRSAQGQGT